MRLKIINVEVLGAGRFRQTIDQLTTACNIFAPSCLRLYQPSA
jgi:hypothetical protein